jgi:hypothetical protein
MRTIHHPLDIVRSEATSKFTVTFWGLTSRFLALVVAGGLFAWRGSVHAGQSLTLEPAHPLPSYAQIRLADPDPGRDFYPSFAVGDFNEDGRPDVAVLDGKVGGGGVELGVSVFLQSSNGTFAKRDAHLLNTAYTLDLIAADFTGDGHLDLLANDQYNDLLLLTGHGDGTFEEPRYLGLAAPLFPVTADFNGDGRQDLAAGALDGTVQIFTGTTNGDFRVSAILDTVINQGPSRTGQILIGDVNRDGKLDVVVESARNPDRTGNLDVFLGNGDGTFKPVVTTTNVGVWRGALGDFNGDGILDFAGDRYLPAQVEVWLGRGDGTFTRGAAYGLPWNPTWVQTGDLNSDGILDIVVAAEGSAPNFPAALLSIFLGNGNGTFQARQSLAPLPGYTVFNLGPRLMDFDADGLLDIVTVAAHPTLPNALALDRHPGVRTDPKGGFLIKVQSAETNRTALDWSSDLVHWFPMATNPAPVNIWPLVDPTANQSMRFYRTRKPIGE